MSGTKATKTTKKRKPTAYDQEKKRPAAKAEVPKDLAAKKRHVRELASGAKWDQITRLYGEKMVVKAKKYIKKNGATPTNTAIEKPPVAPEPIPEIMTPQLLAKQILAKNGYNSPDKSPPKTLPTTDVMNDPVVESRPAHSPSPGKPSKRKQTQYPREAVINTPARERSDARQPTGSSQRVSAGSETTPIVIVDSPEKVVVEQKKQAVDSPETLTEEQKRRIEDRRREALEKRKRVNVIDNTPAWPSHRAPDRVEMAQQQPRQMYSHAAPTKMAKMTPARVTSAPYAEEISAFDESMLRELEIAAQITDWDIDESVTRRPPRLVTPPLQTNDRRGQPQYTRNPRPERPNGQHDLTRDPVIKPSIVQPGPQADVSISQELAAAAQIAFWEFDQGYEYENEQEQQPEEQTHKRPHPGPHLSSSRPGSIRDEHVQGPTNTSRPLNEPMHNEATAKQSRSTKDQHETSNLESFMAKHFLDDKLDSAVLDFVNMMLA